MAEHPEKLQIQTTHRRLEVLGHKYVFGLYEESANRQSQYGVDLAEELDMKKEPAPVAKEQPRRTTCYDDGSETESSSSGRLKRRRHFKLQQAQIEKE